MNRVTMQCVWSGFILLSLAPPYQTPQPHTFKQISLAQERSDLGHHFNAYGVEGTFVLLDDGTGRWVRYNASRARQQFIPASTFKIFNSLVALETKVIANEFEVIRWDSVDRGRPEWNQDQRMKEAFQRSTVWFYQELARRIGEKEMMAFLESEQYGNQNTSGGIDRFWLTGGLRISAEEQVAFLRRLHRHTLKFSQDVMNSVLDLMVLQRTAEYTLRGKTGWAQQNGHELGWLVGSVEHKDQLYLYAMNLETSRPDFPMVEARRAITFGILRELGILPQEEK